jgi:hypothetical protein
MSSQKGLAMPRKPKPSDDGEDDVTIEISDEVANSPLSIGDFVDAVALIQNRMNGISMAVIRAASDDHTGVRDHLRQSIEIGKDINRLLNELAGNVGSARRGN